MCIIYFHLVPYIKYFLFIFHFISFYFPLSFLSTFQSAYFIFWVVCQITLWVLNFSYFYPSFWIFYLLFSSYPMFLPKFPKKYFLPWKFKLACVLSHFSHVQLFVLLWIVAYQAPLSKGFSRQEYWSGLPCPSPRDPGIKPTSFTSPSLKTDSLTLVPPGSLSYFVLLACGLI